MAPPNIKWSEALQKLSYADSMDSKIPDHIYFRNQTNRIMGILVNQ
jgi:hypothetical protein